jgi:DNA-binding MarR family transcriptional regulator
MADLAKTLPGLFTEIAILEHLVRNRFERKLDGEGLSVRQFGIVNYFVRTHPDPDSVSGIAWAFQNDEDSVLETVRELAGLGFVALTPGIVPRDSLVALTPAGRQAQMDQLASIGPEISALVSEIPAEDIDTAYRVLHEIRLVMDNLPDR